MPQQCLNCNHPLEAQFQYCPRCGQLANTRRLRLTEILLEAWMKFTDIDRGFFTLLRDLVVRPGKIAREYIAGQRRRHFPPLTFYLIVGTIMILVMGLTARLKPPPTGDAIQMAINEFWSQYSDLVSIAAAPLLCIIFWLCYRPAGFNYAEHLVACLYMMGFTNLMYALVFSPAITLSSGHVRHVIPLLFKVCEIAYFSYFYAQLTRDLFRRPVLRAILISILASVFWSVLTYSLMSIYITIRFNAD